MIDVSICIPTYNQTKFLKKTLDSILIQSYVNYEIIITDDSNTNDVENLVHDYLRIFNDKLIYFKNTESLGAPKNWNHAMSLAKGRWIKILHHDDWFCDKNSLLKMMEKTTESSDALIFAGIKGDYFSEKRQYINLPKKEMVDEITKNPFTLVWGNYIGPPSTILFSKCEVLFDENLKWLVDIDFYLQLLLKHNRKLTFVNEVLFENCIEEHNISNKCFQNKEVELREFNFIFRKYYPKSNLIQKILFFQKLKKQISTYAKVSYIEIFFHYFKKK